MQVAPRSLERTVRYRLRPPSARDVMLSGSSSTSPVPTTASTDIARMREKLFFEGMERARKLSAFWTLLLLAAAIASAGVVSDSTATVIGAMIVAPLMTPIVGIVLAVTIGDGRNLAISVALVVTGALAVIVIGYGFGLLAEVPVDAATSSQVAGRVNPSLIDLAAAIATGAVGAFAVVRSDVSDTLPGVAIAISLVPPLAVAGLTLEAGEGDEAVGALLLFVTNVGAILVTGVLVMTLYRVRTAALESALRPPLGRRAAITVIVAFVVVIAVPLAGSTARIVDERLTTASVTDVASEWAARRGWEIVSVAVRPEGVVVRALGPAPAPDPDALRSQLDAAGLADVDVLLQLVPEDRIDLAGSES
jgi:uncharacterized hydrophobic protein (TIGR00271 family)